MVLLVQQRSAANTTISKALGYRAAHKSQRFCHLGFGRPCSLNMNLHTFVRLSMPHPNIQQNKKVPRISENAREGNSATSVAKRSDISKLLINTLVVLLGFGRLNNAQRGTGVWLKLHIHYHFCGKRRHTFSNPQPRGPGDCVGQTSTHGPTWYERLCECCADILQYSSVGLRAIDVARLVVPIQEDGNDQRS
ncbi:hypothetical protein T265_05467 [Opisthorchis viverrini]|uniref:Uncharacterized protein n=1 Tax=Opisthorchis viverrini TaxID=6198 RepID=A0A074ZNX9_OPIVI|nr:hypothetical protein T265_05467 [Opisthorchis viverrini]KER27507.1 hypothetical protein T265_05467 [Opisthorchis viverrini]